MQKLKEVKKKVLPALKMAAKKVKVRKHFLIFYFPHKSYWHLPLSNGIVELHLGSGGFNV